MRPGLPRAIPMGIVGFAIGALLAIAIRLLQGLDPDPVNPNAWIGPALVLGSFISAGVFIWGMGGFDPTMSVHGEGHDEHHEDETDKPQGTLGSAIWRVTFWTLLLVLGVGAIAFLPQGPSIRNVHPGEGDVIGVGYVTFGEIYQPTREFLLTATALDLLPPLGANLASIQVSYLTLLLALFAWTVFSLFLLAGIIAWLINFLARGKKDPQGTSLPWRALVYIALIAGPLLSLPLLIPNRQIPMALLAPAFIVVPLVLFIMYRNLFWGLLLLISLGLPVLVPAVDITHTPALQFACIGAGFLGLAFMLIKPAVSLLASENVWRILMNGALALATIGIFVLAIGLNANNFWALLFNVFVVAYSLLLILPTAFLRSIIPAGLQQRFDSTEWSMIIPRLAAWLASFIRRDLPSALGQK